jgi:flagellar basal body-associated protein FliL
MHSVTALVIVIVVVLVVALALAAVFVVAIVGILREEDKMTMTRISPPGAAAGLARRIVGLYVRKASPEPPREELEARPARDYEPCG